MGALDHRVQPVQGWSPKMTQHELPKITHESALKKILRKRKMLRQVDGFAKGAG